MPQPLTYTAIEKEVLNPIVYPELKRLGVKDFQICKIYGLRSEAMKKFKRSRPEVQRAG